MHPTTLWRPPADIYETPSAIIVVIELAGVTLFSDLLVVEGKREQPVTDMNACHQLGIQYGNFRSEINIHATVDHENVRAEYKNGLLKITLKKLM
jgi:HSP20 family molecular chaperone IbpA